jgi:hypothetical protein
MSQNNAHHKPENERPRAMLVEDTGSESEADALLPTVERLRRHAPPLAASQSTAALISQLSRQLEAQKPSGRSWRWPLLLVRSQARIIRAEIWLASALVMAVGTVVTLADANAALMGGLLPLTTLAPVVAAVGIALLYDTDIERILELEDSTPASARMLLLARLALVFGFDLLLALAASVILALTHAELSLWPLVMSWLAPMAFLSALAFFVSVAFIDSLAGTMLSLAIWVTHVTLRSATSDSPWVAVLSMPGLDAPGFRPLIIAAATILVVVALWLVGHTERKTGDMA